MFSNTRWLAVVLFGVAACGAPDGELQPRDGAGDGAILYEGARLIVGDGTTIESSAFLVEGDRIAQVAEAGTIEPPAGATRVDLSGKTVMPALIDAHGHLGYEGYMSWEGENYTRENVIEHLNRYAYYGFGAVLTTGTDPDELVVQMQQEQAKGEFGGARLLFAAGMAPPGQGPNQQLLESAQSLGRVIVRGAATEEEGRAAVREVATMPIPFVKIWVDDRGGTQEKLQPNVYRAIIDEAEQHGIRVIAHQQTIDDMKDLLRAGVAGFLHGRIGPAVDDELVQLLLENDAFVVPNILLGERGRERIHEDPLLLESISPEVATRLRDSFQERPPSTPEQEAALRNAFMKLVDADVEIILGTDAGGVPDHFFGYTGHKELQVFTRLGMTPMQAIVAATQRAAEHLGLEDMGTIAPGKSADFIVLDANPLDDISNTQRIQTVVLRGEQVDREALRASFGGTR